MRPLCSYWLRLNLEKRARSEVNKTTQLNACTPLEGVTIACDNNR